MKNTCGSCKNYTGLGDWNLCCTESHDPKEYSFGHLCYKNTPACDKYKSIVKLTQEQYIEKYCHNCGSQRCEGIGTDWFEGCRHRYELENYTSKENKL